MSKREIETAKEDNIFSKDTLKFLDNLDKELENDK